MEEKSRLAVEDAHLRKGFGCGAGPFEGPEITEQAELGYVRPRSTRCPVRERQEAVEDGRSEDLSGLRA